MIVESAEDQPQAFERLDEEAAFQKVKSPPLFLFPRGTKLHTLSHVHFSSDLFFFTEQLAKLINLGHGKPANPF